VFILFGEKIHSESCTVGLLPCGVCGQERPFDKIVETSYFCIFGLRLLPIEKLANYSQCNHCNNAFDTDASDAGSFNTKNDLPTHIVPLKRILSYLQVGYGMQTHRDLAQDICLKVCSFEYSDDEFSRDVLLASQGKSDIYDYLKIAASRLNMRGKQEIIEAAFLITHACCEIQYEDRLRINLMGNALGVSLEFVSSIIDHVHAQGCYGVRRILPTKTQTS